jgi:cysteine desulfurase
MASGTQHEIYLDNNATTQPLPQVREAMLAVLGEQFGNPSSTHASGDRAREAVRHARESVAQLIGADPSEIIFTSSGTEANNMILASVLRPGGGTLRVVTTDVEHSSIPKYCEYLRALGVDVVSLPVDRAGRLSLADVEAAVTPETTLVSVQWVNNETGVIQPVDEIGALCRSRGVPFHTDAAQAVGKLAIDVTRLPIDFLSFTAHKFHGPQGVGGLYVRNPRWLMPMFYGGAQEFGLRPGTENVPGIVGMGKAAELRLAKFTETQGFLRELRDRFETLVLDMVPDVEVNGDTSQRVGNTTNLLFRGLDGEALVAQLDLAGVRCSQSSACTNARPEPSYVLRAMGLTEDEAYASVRFSVAEHNTGEEVEYAAQQIMDICQRLRAFSTNARHLA